MLRTERFKNVPPGKVPTAANVIWRPKFSNNVSQQYNKNDKTD